MELQFHDVAKRYGAKEALRGIDLTLTPGVYGLLGPNGAGKSTLMNILTGNLRPTRGHVTLDGEDTVSMGEAFRRRLGYCPQQQALYPGFTGEQFLYYMASLQGMSREDAKRRMDWALARLDLTEAAGCPIRGWSGGMKQRLLLAQSLLHDPDILVLDEPTAGLDPRQRVAVRNLIGEIAGEKIVLAVYPCGAGCGIHRSGTDLNEPRACHPSRFPPRPGAGAGGAGVGADRGGGAAPRCGAIRHGVRRFPPAGGHFGASAQRSKAAPPLRPGQTRSGGCVPFPLR
ncbi:MAG: ABC transporter ATP-binding protein [Vescimonas sp.]